MNKLNNVFDKWKKQKNPKNDKMFFYTNNNLEIYQHENCFKLSGSLVKFHLGDNIENFTYPAVKQAIEKLNDELQINLNYDYVTRLDTSVNLTMSNPCSSYYSRLGRAKYLKAKTDYNNKNSLYFAGNNKVFTIYDKIKEHDKKNIPYSEIYKDTNILRLELRYKNRLRKQIGYPLRVQLRHLADRNFFNKCADNIKKEFENIEKLPQEFKMKNIKIDTPSEFSQKLALIGIENLGLKDTFELLEQSTKDMTPTNRNRTKLELKKLISYSMPIDEIDLIKELNDKFYIEIEKLKTK